MPVRFPRPSTDSSTAVGGPGAMGITPALEAELPKLTPELASKIRDVVEKKPSPDGHTLNERDRLGR